MPANTYYRRNRQLVAKILDQEAVLLNMEKNALYTLNESALSIWKFLWKKRTTEEVVDFLTKRYNLSSKQALSDCHRFIQAALKDQLIIHD